MEKIGYCYVVCDILHDGHIKYFRECKKRCDYLICGLLTDDAVEIKPEPILPFGMRYRILSGIKYIDEIVPQDEQLPLNNINWYEPYIVFESYTHTHKIFDHLEAQIKLLNKKVIFIGNDEGRSSTQIKEKIIDTHNSKRKT